MQIEGLYLSVIHTWLIGKRQGSPASVRSSQPSDTEVTVTLNQAVLLVLDNQASEGPNLKKPSYDSFFSIAKTNLTQY